MSEEEEIRLEMESRMTEEMKLWFRKLIEATHAGDELGVARAVKRYNQLHNKVRGR
jgi:hypothetical protein